MAVIEDQCSSTDEYEYYNVTSWPDYYYGPFRVQHILPTFCPIHGWRLHAC